MKNDNNTMKKENNTNTSSLKNLYSGAVCSEVLCKKGVLWNFAIFTGKHLCSGLRSQACNYIKKGILVQVFSCKFCEISKNVFSYRTPPVAASVYW